jgi:hypothetical protein
MALLALKDPTRFDFKLYAPLGFPLGNKGDLATAGRNKILHFALLPGERVPSRH